MDWYLPNDHAAGSSLRGAVREYLERHAAAGSDIGGAELVFAELVTNAIEHTRNDVWVSIDWGSVNPVVTIHDLGPGFELDTEPADPISASGRGLMVASHLTRELGIAAKKAGGTKVTAVLDLERADTDDHDFIPSATGRLPEPSEAVDGSFGREPFLRALVVQLAETLEFQHGPLAAEAAVAQVGANVGGNMEKAYREHHQHTGDFTPAEIGDFYVALKRAIDGDFYVVSVDDERVVLGNRRCPFGDAVKHAPSLCRMTSSVFGGIAARNLNRDVAVHLEERIAVGDPECRVTVWFDAPPPEIEAFVHRYRHQRTPATQ